MTTATPGAARAAADNFALSVGEEPAKVGLVEPQWKDLLHACARVEIHCTAWRAETTLSLEDLAIHTDSDEEARALSAVLLLGRRLLLPKSVVDRRQTLENKFRAALYRRSFDGIYWGRLVPQHRYAEWKAEAEAIRAEYLAFAQWVYDNWEPLVEEVRYDYRVLGLQNYRRLAAAGRQPATLAEEWVPQFVTRCMAKMESKDYWLSHAKMWWDVGYIPLKSLLAEDDAKAAHEAAIQIAKTEMERDILKGAAKQFEDGLFQFVRDVKGEITDRVFNVMVDVLQGIDKNEGELPRNSSKQLRNLVDAVMNLKFWDDQQLDEQMASIRAMLDTRPDHRDGVEITRSLRLIGAEARLVLARLDREPERRSRHVGIPEIPQKLEQFVRAGREVPEDAFALPLTPGARRGRSLVTAEPAIATAAPIQRQQRAVVEAA